MFAEMPLDNRNGSQIHGRSSNSLAFPAVSNVTANETT